MTSLGFPGGTSGKELACQSRRPKRCRFIPWVEKIPWKRAWQPTPIFLLGESHGQRKPAGYSPWGGKELDTTKETVRTHVWNHKWRSGGREMLQFDLSGQYLPTPAHHWGRRQWHPTPVLLPGESHGRRSLWAIVHGVTKSQTQLSDFTFTFHFHFSLSCIGEGNGNPLQCSCLENPRDGGAWWAAIYGVAQSQTWQAT